MLSGILTKISRQMYAIGAVLLAVLAAIGRMQFLKNARNKAEEKADILSATINAERVKKKIIKEEENKLSSRRAELIKEIEKKRRKGETFEGVDNLTDPNDY
jgi:hypothetical protein